MERGSKDMCEVGSRGAFGSASREGEELAWRDELTQGWMRETGRAAPSAAAAAHCLSFIALCAGFTGSIRKMDSPTFIRSSRSRATMPTYSGSCLSRCSSR